MVSARGGIEIEKVAEEDPEAVARLHVNPLDGMSIESAHDLVDTRGARSQRRDEGAAVILLKLYECYTDGDADLVEINPLVLTTDGEVRALDTKVTLDDDAAFRHPEWAEIDNLGETSERERLAKSKGLAYIALDGSVGIIANGAGLAMSTVDVVSQVGGTAANFLDVGGGADEEVMAAWLKVINLDPSVRSILVNIFGGIVRCDEVASRNRERPRQESTSRPRSCFASMAPTPPRPTGSSPRRPRTRSSAEKTMLGAARPARSSSPPPDLKEDRSCEHLRRRRRPA